MNRSHITNFPMSHCPVSASLVMAQSGPKPRISVCLLPLLLYTDRVVRGPRDPLWHTPSMPSLAKNYQAMGSVPHASQGGPRLELFCQSSAGQHHLVLSHPFSVGIRMVTGRRLGRGSYVDSHGSPPLTGLFVMCLSITFNCIYLVT